MSKEKKVFSLKVVFGVLIASVFLLGALTFINLHQLNRLEKQIVNLKKVNESLLDSSISEYVVLNFVDIDGSITPYLVNKNLSISVYDFLLTTPDFTDSDFDSFDGENFYFAALSVTEYVKTEVIELEDNSNYYSQDQWGKYLTVGLQAIILNQNYTIVRSLY